MKKFYKYFGIIGIMLFSFYYTEKIALLMRQRDPIYETITDVAKENEVTFVNAIINEDTIIPGINGLSVNVDKSFQKMKSFGAFNKYYLTYDQIKPHISLEDNKEKIITKGNPGKRSIAIILEEENSIAEYLKEKNVKASILINQENFKNDTNLEQINNDTKNFLNTEKLLNSINKNKNICVLNSYNEKVCREEKKYLVKTTLELTSYNLASIKNKIESGSIILIKKSVDLNSVKLLLNQINYKGLNLITLSELILEENTELQYQE